MGHLPAVISDVADIRELDCLLPDDVQISAIVLRLVELMHFPLVTSDCLPLTYGLVSKYGRALDPHAKPNEMHLPTPLRARLVPEIVAAQADLPHTEQPEDEDSAKAGVDIRITEERSILHDEGLDLKADVRIDAEVHKQVEEFAAQSKRTESFGLLLGTINVEDHERIIHIKAVICATEAESDRSTVKVTLNAWEPMLTMRDNDYPDLRVLGWFHSHAGWGVFLSDSDVFVHKHFFPHPNMVAYVLDTCIGRDGFFYWHGGVLGICPSYGLVGTSEQLGACKRLSAKDRLWVKNTVKVVVAICVAGILYLGYAMRPVGHVEKKSASDSTVTVKPAVVPVHKMRTDIIYVIAKRDNLWLVCHRVYKNGDLAMALAHYNGLEKLNGLQVGQKIRLPAKEVLTKRAASDQRE